MADIDAAWKALEEEAVAARGRRIVGLFEAEPERMQRMVVEAAGLRLDLSKQPWSLAGLRAALALAEAAGVRARRTALFSGEAINTSEDRAVLHPALRASPGAAFRAKGEPVSGEVEAMRAKMRGFSEAVRSGVMRSASGRSSTSGLSGPGRKPRAANRYVPIRSPAPSPSAATMLPRPTNPATIRFAGAA